jgi:hypothetical protein
MEINHDPTIHQHAQAGSQEEKKKTKTSETPSKPGIS